MPEQEKPLEEGWYWVRLEPEGDFMPSQLWRTMAGQMLFILPGGGLNVEAAAVYEIGPRLQPPQGKE